MDSQRRRLPRTPIQRTLIQGRLLRHLNQRTRVSQRKNHLWDALFDLKPLEALLDLNQDIVETNWQPGEYARYLLTIFTAPTNWHPQQLTGCTLTDHSSEVIARFITTPYGEIEPISRLYRLDYQTQSHTLRA